MSTLETIALQRPGRDPQTPNRRREQLISRANELASLDHSLDRAMHPPRSRASAGVTTAAVPLAEAKNQLSALIARVEQGEEIAITRRGLPVARLVPNPQRQAGSEERARRVAQALQRLQTLRAELTLDGDLRAIARAGLD